MKCCNGVWQRFLGRVESYILFGIFINSISSSNCYLYLMSTVYYTPLSLQQITIGIHSGEVVTGVIGNRVPRYCLFGNTVNLTSRTETTGVPGRINISEETYR